MKRFLSTLAVAGLIFAIGCSSGKPPETKDGSSSSDGGKDGGKTATKLEALGSTGAGAVEGKILYDGTVPAAKAIDMSKDESGHCKKDPDEKEKADQTWAVDANGGVGNVIVWVQAPKGKYFKLTDKDKAKKDDVVVSQPYCAFKPHVFAIYPSYYDEASKKQKPTGQVFKVVNDAAIPHNSNVEFGNSKLTNGKNELLPKKDGDTVKGMDFKDVKPCKDTDAGGSDSIKITCNVHPWMKAFGRSFDHPFFTVTKDGTFKIENVPAGTELEVMYWHESMPEPKSAGKIKIEADKTAKVADVKLK